MNTKKLEYIMNEFNEEVKGFTFSKNSDDLYCLILKLESKLFWLNKAIEEAKELSNVV